MELLALNKDNTSISYLLFLLVFLLPTDFYEIKEEYMSEELLSLEDPTLSIIRLLKSKLILTNCIV